MDTKITLPMLAKILAQKKKMTQKNAEAFLREFFDAIIQNVTTDKIVKVKGLGTFKLIEVLDRESVNIGTGERIVIPGHSKLSFTPDASLRDIVNKPFADFQTVVINEGTSLEEMERIPEEEIEDNPSEEDEKVETITPEDEIQESSTKEEEEVVEMQKPEEKIQEKPAEEIPVPEALIQQNQPEPKPTKRHNTAKICATIVGIILLCLISFYAGYGIKRERGTKSEVQEEKQKEQESKTADTLQTVSTSLTQAEQYEETEYAQVPNGEYKIIGTRKTHVMKRGDYLTKIAVEEYGDKEFTRYIIVHNHFQDPNNVPVAAEILLPELEKTE